MANQIRMTPDVMRQRANEYRTQGEAVNEVISKMDQLLGQLQSEWRAMQVKPMPPAIRN